VAGKPKCLLISRLIGEWQVQQIYLHFS